MVEEGKEHTDIFGIDSNLSPLAERFGMHYVADALTQMSETEGHRHQARDEASTRLPVALRGRARHPE